MTAPQINAATGAPFKNSIDHLLAELERIDCLIRVQVRRARELHARDEYQGLYISENEVDDLMERSAGLPRWALPDGERLDGRTLAEVLRGRIDERLAATGESALDLRLTELARLFDLSELDRDIVLICLAQEIDLRYERLYAYLQDDVTRKRPGVDLVLNLLCEDLETKLAARQRFAKGQPLLFHELIEFVQDPPGIDVPLLSRYLKLNDRIAGFLLGSDENDSKHGQKLILRVPHQRLEELVLPEGLAARLLRVTEGLSTGRPLVLALQGAAGAGRFLVAQALCADLGLRVLVCDLIKQESDAALLALARDAAREARLQGAAVYWKGFDALLEEEQRPAVAGVLRIAFEHGGFSVLPVFREFEPGGSGPAAFVRVEIPYPTFAERVQLWGEHAWGAESIPSLLAAKFRLSAQQIADSGRTALSLAAADGAASPSADHYHHACQLHSNRKLASLARKIVPRYGWPDIVLPADRLDLLREICAAVRYRAVVFENWGFDRKLSLGKGINVLFAGPSGTGKTMAAEVLAKDLGQELYKIDLSTVVSKYIGETEKNLSRIFAEAASSNAILFFDEADALFGKRTEVRDAHDRYANIEVNYLLQEMEHYEGVTILATNLTRNMDDAFVRRMHFAVDFPFPDAEDRLRIWRNIWPTETPMVEDGLDLVFLAKSFELAGGSIRNIALGATFLAAAEPSPISMPHVVRAIRREYQKMGKIMTGGEFGDYHGKSSPP